MAEGEDSFGADPVALCRELYGEIRDVEDFSWPHGESRVIVFNGPDGLRRVAKLSRRETSYQREIDAYRHVVSALAPNVPGLIHDDPARRFIVTTFLEGQVVENTAHDNEQTHRAAGHLIRRLHTVLPPRPSRTYTADLVTSLEEWVQRGRGLISAADLPAVRSIVDRARGVGEVPLVFTHGDNTPRNWLLHPGHGLCLIDFAASRWAHWTADVDRLRGKPWRLHPQLRAAFLSGYGMGMSADDALVADALEARSAVSTIVWAHEHNDPAFEADGRSVLAGLQG